MVNKNENGKGKLEELIVEGHKISSVGPGKVTGDKVFYHPNNIDLSMKSHYLRLVYFFDNQAVLGLGLNVPNIKECFFSLLEHFYEACGRFRPSDATVEHGGTSRRPYLKCNDCGMRFVEACSPHTMDEWLSGATTFHHGLLVCHHALGPDLMFSPPVFIQITSFKCGGVSLGLSWAHVLGDAFSLSHFMYQLAQFLQGKEPPYPPKRDKSPPMKSSTTGPIPSSTPLCLKQVGPLGDYWAVQPNCNMETFSFHVNTSQLGQILKKNELGPKQNDTRNQHFEALCAVIWRAIAKNGPGLQLDTVTVIRHDPTGPKTNDMILRNSQIVSTVKAHFLVAEAHLKELVRLIRDEAQDERAQIEEMVGRDPGGSDFIVYGSNLTFVDLKEAEFYEFGFNGLRPKLVNCFVDSIGEEGVVLVLPGPKNDNKDNDANAQIIGEEKIVTLILPKNYMEAAKQELKECGLIA